jgi:hypothetical protein
MLRAWKNGEWPFGRAVRTMVKEPRVVENG